MVSPVMPTARPSSMPRTGQGRLFLAAGRVTLHSSSGVLQQRPGEEHQSRVLFKKKAWIGWIPCDPKNDDVSDPHAHREGSALERNGKSL